MRILLFLLLLISLLLPATTLAQTTYDLSCDNVAKIRIGRLDDTYWNVESHQGHFHVLMLDLKPEAAKTYLKLRETAPWVTITYRGEDHTLKDIAITANGGALQKRRTGADRIRRSRPHHHHHQGAGRLGRGPRGMPGACAWHNHHRLGEGRQRLMKLLLLLLPHLLLLLVPASASAYEVYDITCENVVSIRIERLKDTVGNSHLTWGLPHRVFRTDAPRGGSLCAPARRHAP